MIIGPKVIFVDGIVGSGKSRLAQRLWLHLRKVGADAEWFAEPQSGHPLHDLGDISAFGRSEALDLVFQTWRGFVAERRGTARITVLDATLLQTTVRFFEAFGVPQPEWRPTLAEMLQIAEPLSPLLIYLRPESCDGFLEWVAEMRGVEWRSYVASMFVGVGGDLAGMKAYYAQRLRQDLALIDDLGLPSVTLVSDREGGDERYAAACAFLGIDTPEPADAYPGDIALLADRYREPVSGVSWALEIRDGRLGFSDGDRPHLIHVEGTRFVLEGRPLDAVFTLDARGCAERLRFSGPLRDDPLPGTEWYRVAR
jgi:hypothetical protein